MTYWKQGRGWLLALVQTGPSGVTHVGFSGSDKSLCGRNAVHWPVESFRPERTYCRLCWDKAVDQFPELETKG